MKKKFLILVILLFAQIGFSQDSFDAMRYANTNHFGTARFTALGGAMGALGGDFSAINVNPAGSAIFNTSQAAATLSNTNTQNKSNFFGGKVNESSNRLDINQAGGVWVFTDTESAEWDKITFALNYEKTNNFDDRTGSAGINPLNSVANYFLSYANGVPLNVINNNSFESLSYGQQQTFLGYEGYIIGPRAGSTNQYESNISGVNNFYQENTVRSTGYNGKLNFNIGASLKNKYFFGLNLNAHFTDFTRTTSFYEDYQDSAGHNPNSGVQSLRFSNDLYTYGTGFSFQLGAIAKITNSFRVGLAYDSPTWYNLNDELQQTLNVNCPDCRSGTTNFFADPNVKMIYPIYRLRTPGKATASLAYIFGKNALLSFDYTFKDYSGTEFLPVNDFTRTNSENRATFREGVSEFRGGAEYRIKQWSVRGGYRFEQSPYKDRVTIGNMTTYSGGLGYKFDDFKIDLSYVTSRRNSQQQFFSQGLIDRANLNTTFNNVFVTVVFEL
jgi:hypothetical protein